MPRGRPSSFTPAQKSIVLEYYKNTSIETFDLVDLSKIIGKSKVSICSFARRLGLGLTDPCRSINNKTRIKAMKPRWQDKPHPRGFLGGKHTPEALKKVSEASKRNWALAKATNTVWMAPEALEANRQRMAIRAHTLDPAKNHTRAKGGHRADLGGRYFRSSWEANYARYLNLLIKMKVVEYWEYESETFWFDGIKRGVLSYKPDFKVKYRDDPTPEYVEIKGWVVAKDHTKWHRLKKYHPHIKHVVVGAKEYRSIKEKWASAIPEWETAARGKKPA